MSNKGGRPLTLTTALVSEIAGRLAQPNPITTVCALVGISEATYHRWRKRGQDAIAALHGKPDAVIPEEDRVFVTFHYEVARARALGELGLKNIVLEKAKAGDERSAMWLLERMYRQNWQHSAHIDVNAHHEVSVEDRRTFVQKLMDSEEGRARAGDLLDDFIAKDLASAGVVITGTGTGDDATAAD